MRRRPTPGPRRDAGERWLHARLAHGPRIRLAATLALLVLAQHDAGLLGCAKRGAAPPPERAATAAAAALPGDPVDVAAATREARRLLLDARQLHRDGRLEAAERTTRRGLQAAPNSAPLHRLRAELLQDLGRPEQARAHAARADELDPPPPPLPAVALDPPGRDWLIVLLPPPADASAAGRAPRDWPSDPVHAALAERLALRLPEARVREAPAADAASLASLREWLAAEGRARVASLRVDRAFCAESIKDGRFGLAVLRTADAEPASSGMPAAAGVETERISRVVHDVATIDAACPARLAARALEDALPSWRDAEPGITRAAPAASWRAAAIRTLFPGLGARVDEVLREGRTRLASGQLAASREAFERALEIDPEHLDARSFLAEVDHSLEVSRQLARRQAPRAESDAQESPAVVGGEAQGGWTQLDPRLTPAARRALEEQLRAEQRRRDELLATLAVLDDDHVAPDASRLAALPEREIPDTDAKGPSRARSWLGRRGDAVSDRTDATATLRVRVLHTPAGDLQARYYFHGDEAAPVLMEEDTRGDGRPDRWVAYANGRRRETWEESRGPGLPDLHVIYAADGLAIERIEIDEDGVGQPSRVFVYREGRLRSEFNDTRGNGRFDHIQHFESDGRLALREEDLDGDGRIDVRTRYRSGRVVRREILNPEAVDDLP